MENRKSSAPRLLVAIVDRDKGNIIADLCSGQKLELNFGCIGFGTARSELLSMLGLGSRDKAVVFSITPPGLVPGVMAAISRRMAIRNPGRGIAFTLPLVGINSLADSYLDSLPSPEQQRKADDTVKFTLIISVFSSGFSDTVMEAARTAGATGGTVLHAKGLGGQSAENILGVNLRDEKDILAIIAPEDDSRTIMEAINRQCGLKSEAGAIVFALPVKDMIGL